jgi:hypothetical protein
VPLSFKRDKIKFAWSRSESHLSEDPAAVLEDIIAQISADLLVGIVHGAK